MTKKKLFRDVLADILPQVLIEDIRTNDTGNPDYGMEYAEIESYGDFNVFKEHVDKLSNGSSDILLITHEDLNSEDVERIYDLEEGERSTDDIFNENIKISFWYTVGDEGGSHTEVIVDEYYETPLILESIENGFGDSDAFELFFDN